MTLPRQVARAGLSAALLIVLMVLGSIGLWIAVPLGWLWIGGRVEGATQSLGAGIGVAFSGVVVSIALLVPLLSWLNRKYGELRAAAGEPPTRSVALEAVLVLTAGVALVLFCLWFFVLAGADPLPWVNQQ